MATTTTTTKTSSFDDARNALADPRVTASAPPTQKFNTAAEGITAFGQVAGELRKGSLSEDVRRDQEDIAKAASILQRDANARAGGVDINGTAIDMTNLPGSEEVNNLKEKYVVLARAHEQGRISDSALQIEAQASLKRTINKAPGFAQEFRKVAQEVLGLDPTGSATQILVDTLNPDPKTRQQTFAQKQMEIAQFRAAATGLSVESILRDMAIAGVQQDRDVANAARLKAGDLHITGLTTEALDEAAMIGRTAYAEIFAQMSTGGISNIEEPIITLNQQRDQLKRKYRRMINDANDGSYTVNNNQIDTMMSDLDEQFDSIQQSIEDADMRKIIMARRDAMVGLSQTLGRKAFPIMSTINDVLGQKGFEFYITMMEQTKGNPAKIASLYGSNPAAQNIMRIQAAPLISDAYEMLATAAPVPNNIDPDMADALNLAAAAMSNLGQHRDADTYNAGVAHPVKTDQPIKAVTTVAGQRGGYEMLSPENKAGVKRHAATLTDRYAETLITEIAGSGTLVNWDPDKGFTLLHRADGSDDFAARVADESQDIANADEFRNRIARFERRQGADPALQALASLNSQVVALARQQPQYLEDLGVTETEWVTNMLSRINGTAVIAEIQAKQETNPIDIKVLQEAAKTGDIGPLLDAAEAAGIADFSVIRDNFNKERPQFFLDPETGAVIQQ